MMLTQVADASAGEEATVVAGTQDDLQGAAPLELRHRILPAGGTIVEIGGELDIATAEPAVRYVRQVIDRHRRPVIVDLTALRFCDAKGLNGLLRMAGNAEQTGCPFRLASPRPSLVKIMRITGLDHKFLAPRQPPIPENTPAYTGSPGGGEPAIDPASPGNEAACSLDLAGHRSGGICRPGPVCAFCDCVPAAQAPQRAIRVPPSPPVCVPGRERDGRQRCGAAG